MDKLFLNKEELYLYLIEYLPKLALAILTLVVGLWLIKILMKVLMKVMAKRKIDESLTPFFKSLITIILRIALMISVMGMVGIEMTSFIALIGAAGLSLGMALSGALQHFAGGVLILLYDPFKKGDTIKAQGYTGVVNEIRLFNTILITFDNKTVFMPNGPLSTSTIVNYTREGTRRLDLTLSIGYSDDIDKAKEIIRNIIRCNELILKEPVSEVVVNTLNTNSVDLLARIWVKSQDYLKLKSILLETVKKEFDRENITIPFPQLDVHIKKEI